MEPLKGPPQFESASAAILVADSYVFRLKIVFSFSVNYAKSRRNAGRAQLGRPTRERPFACVCTRPGLVGRLTFVHLFHLL